MSYTLKIYNYICPLFLSIGKKRKGKKKKKNSSANVMSQHSLFLWEGVIIFRSLISIGLPKAEFLKVCPSEWRFCSAGVGVLGQRSLENTGSITVVWELLQPSICLNVQLCLWEGLQGVPFSTSRWTWNSCLSLSVSWDQCSKAEIWKNFGKRFHLPLLFGD